MKSIASVVAGSRSKNAPFSVPELVCNELTCELQLSTAATNNYFMID